MGFWLKKVIGYWLMPLPFALGLITVGLLLFAAKRAPRARQGLILSGVLWLMVLSNNWVSRQLIRPLEAQFSPVPELAAGAPLPAALAACQFVAVLGSGHTDAPGFPATTQLSTSALARIVEAVRLARLLLDLSAQTGSDEFDLALTHQELASRLGTVREVVSRNLARFRAENLVQVQGHQLRILDRRSLEREAEAQG